MQNILIYVIPLTLLISLHLYRRRKADRAARKVWDAARESGLNEPASLHPLIDASRCIGSGTCANVCPEQALGIVDGKAVLVNASACIGHGACYVACPFDAISLVFGTEKRGVDIPYVKPDFETNVPGIYIAGELGGMGLIRKAAEQGKQAISTISHQVKQQPGTPKHLDVVIVGAGPAGLSAGLGAIDQQLHYVIVEQEDSLGGSIYHYPRQKIAMTAPVTLPRIGKVNMHEISKEDLLAFWQKTVKEQQIDIHFKERMLSVSRDGERFIVSTDKQSYRTKTVLLTIGRRGSPRKLEVPGEELPKVMYKLTDPDQFIGKHMLVVGGGDSALEAAIALARQPDTTVALSYRSAAFSRVKEKNRHQYQELVSAGKIRSLLQTVVKEITPKQVILISESTQQTVSLTNDYTIICAGGVLPIPVLQEMGIRFETKHGTE